VSNIFTLSSGLAEEDRFTGSLNYVIDSHPHIGQAMCDHLLLSAGLEKAAFVRSTDHPQGTMEDRPDFLLECEGIDIVCEHKINSPLGKRQLERYLALQRSKPFVVALISNGVCDVPKAATDHERYICPLNSDIAHFSWQSLYPLIQGDGNRLISDFLEYMRSLSMKPIACESWKDLFDRSDVAEAFGHHWQEVKGYFKNEGATCRIDRSKLAIQIGQPNDWLHLMYVFVSPNAEPRHEGIDGPYLGARLYINSTKFPDYVFNGLGQEFEYGEHQVFTRTRAGVAGWNKDLALVSDYYTSLDEVLTINSDILKRNLKEFAVAVYEHATKRVQGV